MTSSRKTTVSELQEWVEECRFICDPSLNFDPDVIILWRFQTEFQNIFVRYPNGILIIRVSVFVNLKSV